MKRLKVYAAVVLTLLVGCGGQSATPGADIDTGAEAGPASPAPSGGRDDSAAGTAIDLDLTAPAVLGDDIDLSEYAGQDLALWFWAPW